MIMEHFDVHKEQLEDLVVDLHKEGPKVLMDIPPVKINPVMNLNDFALIDEISGFTLFLDNFMKTNEMPEHTKDRIKALMFRYDSEKPKEVALNEVREVLFG